MDRRFLRPNEFKTGDIVSCAVYKTKHGFAETEIYPMNANGSQQLIVTFISQCVDKNCMECDRNAKPHYVYLNTLEYGHVKTLTIWNFEVLSDRN